MHTKIDMKKYRKSLLTLAIIFVLLSAGLFYEKPNIDIFWCNLHSGDTISVLEFAKYNLRQGKVFDGIKYLHLASVRAIEFQKHQQAAQQVIEESARLYQQGDYKNALLACEKARSVLDGYDDEGAMDYECTKLKEELLNQTPNP